MIYCRRVKANEGSILRVNHYDFVALGSFLRVNASITNVELIHMLKSQPGTVQKNSSTIESTPQQYLSYMDCRLRDRHKYQSSYKNDSTKKTQLNHRTTLSLQTRPFHTYLCHLNCRMRHQHHALVRCL